MYVHVRASASARSCWCTEVLVHASDGTRKRWCTQALEILSVYNGPRLAWIEYTIKSYLQFSNSEDLSLLSDKP